MKCTKCKRIKTKILFATFRTRKGELRRRGECQECRGKYAIKNREHLTKWRKAYYKRIKTKHQLRAKKRREEAKAFVNARKNVPCVDCGKKWPPVAMDFDHVEGDKVRSIASLVGCSYKLEIIENELRKCEVVCACCHRLRTAARKDNLAPKKKDRLFLTSPGRAKRK